MKRQIDASLSVLVGAFVCGLCAGCTERQLISHPDFDDGAAEDGLDGDATATTGLEPAGDGEDGANLGNFPEPAITECGVLPPGVDPIPGLSTAWVVTGNVPGSAEGAPYPDDQARVRLADYGHGCDEAFGEITEQCANAWSYELSLAVQNLAPGVYDLASLTNLFPELYMSQADDEGCGGVGVGGGGVGPGAEPQGELEIFSVTGGCVTGELRGLIDDFGDVDVDRNGGFVAMRCESDCVPMMGNDCGK